MVFGDMSCTVFVGQAVNKMDEMVDTVEEALLYIRPRLVNFSPGSPLGRQNTEGYTKIYSAFLYIVWPSAVKFGTVRGICE